MHTHTRRALLLLATLALAGTAITATAQARTTTPTLQPALNGERRTLNLPGFGNVAYYADPRGPGRPLILTHAVNAAASAYEMKPLWDAYAGTRPVYALEWPGFGSSDRPDTPYTPDLMTAALNALIDTLGTDVDVIALSLGSEFAARAALREPRIHTLALISPTGLGRERNGTQTAASTDGGAQLYARLNAVGDPLFWALRTRPSIQYFLSRSFRGPVNTDLINYALQSSAQPGGKYAPLYFISGRLFTTNALEQLYRPLRTPTLVLFDQDAFVNFDRLPDFLDGPDRRAVRIPDTDGLPHFEKPLEVRRALDDFWAAH
ncbi:alpha/beta fold hydrolase [Deinococcus maricopensis]|uniref:Alpha/beta hydrolase fold protein n=1 Tax=Deinococcus maricopensis (strain DSM 21211 / LMG 22137 / NRRL B-23946 / LB-34) TaxID=709986 RepID=E8U343_DEIML|nr:alpha/beta fold hydrolase [Deinococcus maricopensis]ADV65988.1 alpha/beta hydrolase fold protein [Deinococcus maricopensis DSM 21211]